MSFEYSGGSRSGNMVESGPLKIPRGDPNKRDPVVLSLIDRWNAMLPNDSSDLVPGFYDRMHWMVKDAIARIEGTDKKLGQPGDKGHPEVKPAPIEFTRQEEAFEALVGYADDMVANHRGVKAGKVRGRFDLIPPEALQAMADVMERNLASHGRDTWRSLDRDDHVNHALAHLTKYLDHQEDEDHLKHALCRVAFANSRLVEDGEIGRTPATNVRVVYFSHPCGNDIEGNRKKVREYVRAYTASFPKVMAIIPHYNFSYLDEMNGERSQIMAACMKAVAICHTMVICGKIMTPGMQEELEEAKRLGKHVEAMITPTSGISNWVL